MQRLFRALFLVALFPSLGVSCDPFALGVTEGHGRVRVMFAPRLFADTLTPEVRRALGIPDTVDGADITVYASVASVGLRWEGPADEEEGGSSSATSTSVKLDLSGDDLKVGAIDNSDYFVGVDLLPAGSYAQEITVRFYRLGVSWKLPGNKHDAYSPGVPLERVEQAVTFTFAKSKKPIFREYETSDLELAADITFDLDQVGDPVAQIELEAKVVQQTYLDE